MGDGTSADLLLPKPEPYIDPGMPPWPKPVSGPSPLALMTAAMGGALEDLVTTPKRNTHFLTSPPLGRTAPATLNRIQAIKRTLE